MKYKPMPQLLQGSILWQRKTWQYKLYFGVNFIHTRFILCVAFIWRTSAAGNRWVIVWFSSTENEWIGNTLKNVRKDGSGDHSLPSIIRYAPCMQPQQKIHPCRRKGTNTQHYKPKREKLWPKWRVIICQTEAFSGWSILCTPALLPQMEDQILKHKMST